MSQTMQHQTEQQYQITDNQLRLSITNINQIMQKINQTVRKTQGYIKQNDSIYTFVTQQNLITQNIENEESDMIKQLRNKINSMKIPLHQLHKKKKLSTVIQESRSQSGRTNGQTITPRDTDFQCNINHKENYVPPIIIKQSAQSHANKSSQKIQYDDINKMPKKITGIRKMNVNKQLETSKTMRKQDQQTKFKNDYQNKQYKFFKTKSMANIRFVKPNQVSMAKKVQQVYQAKVEPDNNLSKSKSKGKKGLSVMSKRSLKSEQSQKALHRLGNNTLHSKHKTADGAVLSDRKPDNSNQIVVKKRTITPFMASKKSVQLDKKNDPKLKNCLTRTNTRQFFMSKRINR